jgi:hypothetical protein
MNWRVRSINSPGIDFAKLFHQNHAKMDFLDTLCSGRTKILQTASRGLKNWFWEE